MEQARQSGDERRRDQPPVGGHRGDVTPQRAGSGKGMVSRGPCLQHTGQTISFIMRKVLIAISNSATISSEGLIVQLLGVLIADVLIMDPHNAHLAISRFMPHASRRAPA